MASHYPTMPDTNNSRPWWQRRRFRVWASGLLTALVHGMAVSGGSFVSVATAKGIGIDIPQLNLKQLGAVLAVTALKEFFLYLQDNPAPKAEDDTDAVAPLKAGTAMTKK